MELTQEQLAELIVKVLANLTKKGGESFTAEEISEEITAVLNDVNAPDESAPADDTTTDNTDNNADDTSGKSDAASTSQVTVIYSLGARRLGMANGNLNIPKIKTGSRAMFNGENRKIGKDSPKFGNLKLSAKKLTALIPMSNDLLRSTNFDNDVIVGQDITRQMALGVDWGALLGTGGEFQPLGIVRNKNVQNIDVTAIADTSYSDNNGVVTAAFPSYLIASVLKNNVYADGQA